MGTSFMPKESLSEERVGVKPGNILNIGLISLFILTLLISGGAYLYEKYSNGKLEELKVSLDRAKSSFNPEVISDINLLDKRINSAKEILAKHTVVSKIFEAIEDLTLKSVRFSKFEMTAPEGTGPIGITMSGQALSYRSLALQSDSFGKNKYLKDILFSNLNLDNKGNVIFDLSFSVDPNMVLYKELLNKGEI